MRLVGGDAADPSESILDARRIQYHVVQSGDWGWRPQVLEEPLVRGTQVAPPSEADVHIEGMETPGVWRHGRLVVAGTDAIEKTTHLGNLQGWHPDRGPGGALPVDARVPDYANKLGATANFAATFVLARRCVHNLLCQIGDLGGQSCRCVVSGTRGSAATRFAGPRLGLNS